MLKKRTEGDVLRMGAAGEGEGEAAGICGAYADERGRLFTLRGVDPDGGPQRDRREIAREPR